MFADLDLARLEAETTANKLSTGELDVLTLTSENRLSYVRAVEALKPSGVPLEMAAMQFAEASKLLDGARSWRRPGSMRNSIRIGSRKSSCRTSSRNC